MLFSHFLVAVLPISVLYLSLELWEQKVMYRWVTVYTAYTSLCFRMKVLIDFLEYKCWSCVLQLIRCLESSQFQNCRMLTYVGTYELTAKFTLNPTLCDFQHCCVQLLWLVKHSILSRNIAKQQKSILYTWLSRINIGIIHHLYDHQLKHNRDQTYTDS